MPKRQAARERAQATVDAAAASAQPSLAMTDEDESLLIRISHEQWEALRAIAQGRSPDAVIADLIDDYLRKSRLPT